MLRFGIPGPSIDRLRSIAVSANVNGIALAAEDYTKAGEFLYIREVPAASFRGGNATVDFALDKALPPDANERRELGVHIRDSATRVTYFNHSFPLDSASLPQSMMLARNDPAGRPAVDEWLAGGEGRKRLRQLLERQHYRLVPWREVAQIRRQPFDQRDHRRAEQRLVLLLAWLEPLATVVPLERA